jgi:quercetin 2,3-dioxygenase
VSNKEQHPAWSDCPPDEHHPPSEVVALEPKAVTLGGPDAMRVRRTLPQLTRSFVGAWCFIDHYGPEPIVRSGGMDVPPHPHTSLQTVSWLFAGEIEHRDSGGVHGLVRPGEVNLMTSGAGIAHSEVSTPQATLLHGLQLWVALPSTSAHIERDFQHHVPDLVTDGRVASRLLIGSLAGISSPVRTETPLLAAELTLAAGATWEAEVSPGFEHGVLVDTGRVELDGVPLNNAVLGVRDAGSDHVRLHNPTDGPARVMLLGGEPFDEGIVMWWNFIARTHDEIAELRAEWNAGGERFGHVAGYRGAVPRLTAPPLPAGRLKARFRRGRES